MPGICNIPRYTRASCVHSPLCHQKVDNKPTGMCRLRRCPPGIWSMPVKGAPILWPRDGPVQRALSLSADSEIPWSALCSHTPTTAAFCYSNPGVFSSASVIWIRMGEGGGHMALPLSLRPPFQLQACTHCAYCVQTLCLAIVEQRWTVPSPVPAPQADWLLRWNWVLTYIVRKAHTVQGDGRGRHFASRG